MFAYCNNNPVNYCDESGSYSTYCTTMTDSGASVHINDDTSRPLQYIGDAYIYAPEGYTTTRLTKSPYDVRANFAETITYLSPDQTCEYVYQNVLLECTEGVNVGDFAMSAFEISVPTIISSAAKSVHLGLFTSTAIAWGELYGKSEKARYAQRMVDIMEQGRGMIIVDYSICGILGRWYLPWDESTYDGRYGSYPYVKTN